MSDKEIEKLLGLTPGHFAGALARGRAPVLSAEDRAMCRVFNQDERRFAAMRARLFGRVVLMRRVLRLSAEGRVPDWIDILPLGEFNTNGDDSRGPFHADGAEVIAGTKAQGKLARGLPIDYDHRTFTDDPDSRAAGWIRELRVRGKVLQARVEWTPAARRAIAAGEYRFISPVFVCKPDNPDAPEDKVSGKVLYLRGAGLTNDPALSLRELKRLAA